MDLPYEILASSIAGIFSVVKAFKFVREGERGVRLRFGRAVRDGSGKPVIIDPGFVILIPFVEKVASHHVRQQSYRFPEQRIVLKDGLIYKVAGMIIFQVTDVYRAMFEIENLDHSIDDLGMAAIKEELETLGHDNLREQAEISKRLISRVRERAASWGLEIIQFSLTECAPTPESANLINAGLSVTMRLDALSKGLDAHKLSLQTVSPNLAAVLIGMPMMATLPTEPEKTAVQKIIPGNASGDEDQAE